MLDLIFGITEATGLTLATALLFTNGFAIYSSNVPANETAFGRWQEMITEILFLREIF